MREKMIIATLLLGLLAVPALAQEEEEFRPGRISFQGRVGALFTGSEPFENGAAFEVGLMWRLAGPFHLNISGGTGNFDGGLEPQPLTEEFAELWENFNNTVVILDREKASYRMNFFNFGGALKFGGGAFEPYAVGGAGVYYVRYSQVFSFFDPMFQADITSNATDSTYFYGFNVGGGINFRINDLISFAGQVTYHYINSDVIGHQVMATFGMNVTIP